MRQCWVDLNCWITMSWIFVREELIQKFDMLIKHGQAHQYFRTNFPLTKSSIVNLRQRKPHWSGNLPAIENLQGLYGGNNGFWDFCSGSGQIDRTGSFCLFFFISSWITSWIKVQLVWAWIFNSTLTTNFFFFFFFFFKYHKNVTLT